VDGAGNIYVVDNSNYRVQVFDHSRTYVRTIGVTGEWGNAFDHFGYPTGIALDMAGRIYVADGDRVQVLDPGGAYLTTIGGAWGSRTGQLRGSSADVAVDTAGNVYIADTENHRIQKFAPGVPGWVQSNINGFGDRQNRSTLTLAPFGGYLYAGTYNRDGNGAQLWRLDSGGWTAVITDGFGSSYNAGIDHLMEFNGYLYAGTWADDVNGGEVWRSSDGLNWTRVARQGFGVPTNGEVFRFAVFDDTLYATTWSYTTDHGAEIWRSRTGIAGDWTRVVTNGFGNAPNIGMLSSEVFNGYLYVGTYNLVQTTTPYTSTGAEVWRTNDGSTWTQVNTDGFDTVNNYAVSSLAAFGDYLYAGTIYWTGAGNQVWRCQVCDGSDWTKVVDNGFGNINARGYHALIVFGNHLYSVMANRTTGLEVWRTADGTNWEQVGFAGFGDSNNIGTYWGNSVAIYNNRLYIGTWNDANGGEVWQKSIVTASFTASPTAGVPPLTVTFTNTSSGDYTSSLWGFGDGITSTLTSPTHIYTTAGVYTVTLTVSDGIDTSTITRPNYITVRYSVYLPLILRNY
jgi:PKD repeat protein